jgi:hypothetical protein
MADAQDTGQRAGVDAVVEPIKAAGAALGFLIGFVAAHRSGASLTDAALHGLLGAALLLPVAWYLGLWLVREMMTTHVDEQRRLYTERIETLRARAAETGGDLPAITKPMPRATLQPPP